MFADILENKINTTREIISGMKDFSPESITSSKLDEFTKSFVLHETAIISDANELLALAEKSARLEINYALRPKWTLLNYLFGPLESKPASEILKKLEIFPYYTYYSDIIRALCEEDIQVSIRSLQAENLIIEANIILFEKLTSDITSLKVKNLFLQVFKLKYGSRKEISLDMYIPFMFIRLFLEDKGYTNLLNMFGVIENLTDETDIELKTIIKIFTGKYRSYKLTGTDTVTREEKPGDVKTEEKKTEEEKPHEEEAEQKPVHTEKVYTPEINYNENKEKNRWEETETYEKPPAEKGIRELFREDELAEIAKRIFKSNKYGMYDAFYELEKKRDWREATEFLKEKFAANKVDIRDKVIIFFVDTLNNYFENRVP